MNEISLLIKLIIFNLVFFFFWYLATFRSFQIIHFGAVKIVLTIALISSFLWLIPKIIVFSDFYSFNFILLIKFIYFLEIFCPHTIHQFTVNKKMHYIFGVFTEMTTTIWRIIPASFVTFLLYILFYVALSIVIDFLFARLLKCLPHISSFRKLIPFCPIISEIIEKIQMYRAPIKCETK